MSETVAFIGAGNMASALVRGLLAAGWTPESIRAADPGSGQRAEWEKRFGSRAYESNADAARGADVIFFCVKPQQIDDVLRELAPECKDALVVSIAAGVTLGHLQELLGEGVRIVRAMPNQPALVGTGVTGLIPAESASEDDLNLARRLFGAVGTVEVLPQEDWINVLTAVSGSGPAFLYRVAEALAAGAVDEGLPADLAARLAAQTVLGAGELLTHLDEDPGELVRRVASPGGTTVAGLEVMDERDVPGALRAAVAAATRRARELSGG